MNRADFDKIADTIIAEGVKNFDAELRSKGTVNSGEATVIAYKHITETMKEMLYQYHLGVLELLNRKS